MILSVDRFEGMYALCQDDNGKMYAIAISELPNGSKPGDVLKILDDGEIFIDNEQTLQRKQRIKNLQDKLFK